MAFVEGTVLQVKTLLMFHIRKNGLITVSEKKTAKMRLLVDKFRGDETFVPGKADNPDPEQRLLFEPEVAKADMNNRLGGSKIINDAKVYRIGAAVCAQLALQYNDSKSSLPEYISNFSFPSIGVMQSILQKARDQIIEEDTQVCSFLQRHID